MKARMAIARKLLVIVHHVLGNLELCHEPATPRTRQKDIQQHLKALQKLELMLQFIETAKAT